MHGAVVGHFIVETQDQVQTLLVQFFIFSYGNTIIFNLCSRRVCINVAVFWAEP